jgi:xanthine dehydrogenase small subunit
VVTVEDLAEGGRGCIRSSRRWSTCHGSQCGFCTPGFVMSLFTLFHNTRGAVSREEVNDWIAGNLCRCTGYRPIVDAAIDACAKSRRDRFAVRSGDTAGLGCRSSPTRTTSSSATRSASSRRPRRSARWQALYERHPDATIVSGATDVGLWITKQMRDLPKIILTRPGARLRPDRRDRPRADDRRGRDLCGGRAPYLKALDPDLGELVRRIGSKQVRAAGTVGGNVANGSPIGDMPPVLIALDATLELRRGKDERSMPLEDVLHRLRQAGPRGGRARRFGIVIPKLEKNQIVPLLQGLQALRPGHLGGDGARSASPLGSDGKIVSRRASPSAAWRRRRSRAKRAEHALNGAQLRDSRAWARGLCGAPRGFLSRSTITAPAPATAPTTAGMRFSARR